MPDPNSIRRQRVEEAQARQRDVAEQLRRRNLGMAGMSNLERAAKNLPLKPEPDRAWKSVPKGERLRCLCCGEEILVPGWQWCAAAQANLRSWGHKVVDGRIVR
jgi:hypothetical protein